MCVSCWLDWNELITVYSQLQYVKMSTLLPSFLGALFIYLLLPYECSVARLVGGFVAFYFYLRKKEKKLQVNLKRVGEVCLARACSFAQGGQQSESCVCVHSKVLSTRLLLR